MTQIIDAVPTLNSRVFSVKREISKKNRKLRWAKQSSQTSSERELVYTSHESFEKKTT